MSHLSWYWEIWQLFYISRFDAADLCWYVHFNSSKSFFNFKFGFVFLELLPSVVFFLDSNGFLSLFHESCIDFHKSFGGFRNSNPLDESGMQFNRHLEAWVRPHVKAGVKDAFRDALSGCGLRRGLMHWLRPSLNVYWIAPLSSSLSHSGDHGGHLLVIRQWVSHLGSPICTKLKGSTKRVKRCIMF